MTPRTERLQIGDVPQQPGITPMRDDVIGYGSRHAPAQFKMGGTQGMGPQELHRGPGPGIRVTTRVAPRPLAITGPGSPGTLGRRLEARPVQRERMVDLRPPWHR